MATDYCHDGLHAFTHHASSLSALNQDMHRSLLSPIIATSPSLFIFTTDLCNSNNPATNIHMTGYHIATNSTRVLSKLLTIFVAIITLSSAQSGPHVMSPNVPQSNAVGTIPESPVAGELEKLKEEEAHLASLLASIRQKKLTVLRSRPLTIGIIGFGRFGQFIAKSFTKYGNVIGTSRSDYTAIANDMGAKYIPLSDLESFVMEDSLDVIVVAVSIVSFEDTVKDLVPLLKKRMEMKGASSCPLIVDVLSVKEHPRNILLDLLPEECDVLCTHPMFGPDSAKHGWQGQTFVYERTRIDKVLLDPSKDRSFHHRLSREEDYESDGNESRQSFYDEKGMSHGVHENSDAHVEGMDRMERFLSIWEEEGCNMVSMSCKEHDGFTANSQFITHLMGRILGAQGLQATPIDTKGFQNVLRLVETTNADSFDLFYGLFKFNSHSRDTILKLKESMDDVVGKLLNQEGKDEADKDVPKSCL